MNKEVNIVWNLRDSAAQLLESLEHKPLFLMDNSKYIQQAKKAIAGLKDIQQVSKFPKDEMLQLCGACDNIIISVMNDFSLYNELKDDTNDVMTFLEDAEDYFKAHKVVLIY